MDMIFRRNGTDKGWPLHYGPVYERLFPDRKAVRNILEIGVDKGASLRAWLEIFPKANVIGIDINHCDMSGDRVMCYQCRQDDYDSLMAAARWKSFDLIVDDGSHIINDTLASLVALWPYLSTTGYYVIEELAMNSGGYSNWLYPMRILRGVSTYYAIGHDGNTRPLLVLSRSEEQMTA